MHAHDEGASGRHRDRRRPRLFCFPSTDRLFELMVGRVARRLVLGSPEELLDALRPLYPLISVHARELSGEAVLTWYVYRESTFPAHPGDIQDD